MHALTRANCWGGVPPGREKPADRRRRSRLWVTLVAVATFCAGCSSDKGGPTPPGAEPSLSVLAGTCAVERFEIWSTVQPLQILYDAAANGFTATLQIRANSRTGGSYVLAATRRDPLGIGEVGNGALTLVEPDTLQFQGMSSLVGNTRFELSSSLVTLTNLRARLVTLPAGPVQATTRIVCRY